MSRGKKVSVAKRPRVKQSICNVNYGWSNEKHWLSCDYEGAMYHVYIDPDSGELTGDRSLYQSPPLSVTPFDADYYDTRRLTSNTARGRWLIGEMQAVAKRLGLREAARKRFQEEMATHIVRTKAKREPAVTWEQIKGALVELLDSIDPDTLDAIADEIQSFEHSARADSLRTMARKQRAARETLFGKSTSKSKAAVKAIGQAKKLRH